jgi:Fe-S cluster assembly scaffold protein SufB
MPMLTKQPTFTYGLQIFFDPKKIVLPYAADDAMDAAAPAIRAAGAIVMPLSEAFGNRKYALRLREHFAARDAGDRVDAWRDAAADNGVAVIIPSGARLAATVTIDLACGPGRRADRVVVLAGKGSAASVIERVRSASPGADRTVRAASFDVIAEERASIAVVSLQDMDDLATDFVSRTASAAANARIEWSECIFGGAYVRSRISLALRGEGASARQRSMFFGVGAQRFDLYAEALHFASRTASDLASRGALAGSAKTIARGLVRIAPGANGCDGRQKETTLLLSDAAEIDAVPNLEIHGDDVRCGHGASVGRADKDKIFYLMSRGLDEAAATTMLVEGFFAPLVADFPAGVGEEVARRVAERAATSVPDTKVPDTLGTEI